MPETFQIHEEQQGAVRIFRLIGFLDAHTAPQFEKALQAKVAGGDCRIVVDGSALTYISSAGLGVFMSFIEEVREVDGDIRIGGLISKVRQVFDILGFSEIFRIFPTAEEAVNSFAKPDAGNVAMAEGE
ncbi:MAG: STAS domain-containing protein [Bryobacterales bacterium]|nr:STAS domain-containing protein [Bryobacterales bacterium]